MINNNLKNDLKELLKHVIRNKFKNYSPESSHMPFHTKLLGKDKIALYNFIHSLNTNFGTTIFEPVACKLGEKMFTVQKQVDAGGIITKQAQRVIQDIMDNLECGNTQPNKQLEIEAILKVALDGDISKIKPTKIDLLLQNEKNIYLIDIKTAKPNKGSFKEFKRTLLTWVATYAYQNRNSLNIHTLIAIPYNPYAPKPYQRWTMAGMIDLEEELKVAEEFWNFVGGEQSYELLLSVFEEVGIEMRSEIDQYYHLK